MNSETEAGGGRVFVALGANLGDPAAQVRAAFVALDLLAGRPARRSSLWTSAPLDCPPGSPRFVNAVAEIFPDRDETPWLWLDRLQALERKFGRRPKTLHNESRPLDLDLIAWGSVRLSTERLTLPHPRALERGFVLAPLAELAEGWRWPGDGRTVAELLGALASRGVERLE